MRGHILLRGIITFFSVVVIDVFNVVIVLVLSSFLFLLILRLVSLSSSSASLDKKSPLHTSQNPGGANKGCGGLEGANTQDFKHTDISTYRLNQSRGQFSEHLKDLPGQTTEASQDYSLI